MSRRIPRTQHPARVRTTPRLREWRLPRWPSRAVLATLGAGLLLFVFFAGNCDVWLGIGRGEATGWLTLHGDPSTYRLGYHGTSLWLIGPQEAFARRVRVQHPLFDNGRARYFSMYTPGVLGQIKEAVFVRGGYPPPVPPSAAAPAGVKPFHAEPSLRRVFGRVRYAGLFRRVVYRFEEMGGPERVPAEAP